MNNERTETSHNENYLLPCSGHCLLFTTGTWQEKDGLFDVRWASEAYCNYPIIVGVCLFIIAGVQIYRYMCFESANNLYCFGPLFF